VSWTKRELITQAFEEAGLASYVFDLTADQLQSALRKLDSMMATWDAKGIKIGYPLEDISTSSLDQYSDITDAAVEAVYLNLAQRIAPSFGKQVAQETKQSAAQAYNALVQHVSGTPPLRQINDSLPRGAGNKPWRDDRPFVDQNTDPLTYGSN
jgi:hypothetical protein